MTSLRKKRENRQIKDLEKYGQIGGKQLLKDYKQFVKDQEKTRKRS